MSAEQVNTDPSVLSKLQPTEALTRLLQKAQSDHRECVSKAMAANEDVVEKCNLTWGEVYFRYRQWAQYRAPFQDGEATATWNAYWTPARQEWDDKRPKF